MKESFDEITIGMSSGKARYKSPFLARQLSVVFAPTRYRVVKITHFSFEVVLLRSGARSITQHDKIWRSAELF
jgi:hypothetical protein